MRALIRFLTRGAGGVVETRERSFDGDALTLGRATDRTLHLKDSRVALEHARIVRVGDRLRVICKPPAQALVNGSLCRDAELCAGDTLQVGANTLRFFEPPAGYDVAFTFELDATADVRAVALETPQLSLAELGLRKRPWAWGLFLVFLAGGLLVPWAGAVREGASEVLRAWHLPSDRLWSSGALHLSHAMLETKCESCHARAFQRVRDTACLECHGSSLHRHFATEAVAGATLRPASARCTSCHLEHEEPPQLVSRDERLCAACHGSAAADGMPRAADFARDHPEFHVSVLAPDESLAPRARWQVVRARLDDSSLRERSRLVFPHAKHLDPKGVKAPDGDVVMQCADCHRPEPGGARLQPVAMERDCARCHRLDFDPAEPDRVVPHGDAARVLEMLTEYYSAKYLAGYPDRYGTARPARPVQLPAFALSRVERERLLGVARERAQLLARDLFERRACAQCHEIAREEGADARGETAVAWRVAPVRLTQQWMPAARFDHSRHGTALTPCETCHAASRSQEAGDVLMPAIAVCRDCHGGESRSALQAGRLPSTCTMCHGFHQSAEPLWPE
jgi:predicted CXXCH cytochrome family protein